jgi:hypothetical protein
MHIRKMICAEMPYGGGIISHEASTNDESGDDACANNEKIPKSHPIGSEGFRSNSREFSEMWNLYAKNIMFACSLTTSTSTWCSDYCNGPSGYMSGELKSENINKKKAPTQ